MDHKYIVLPKAPLGLRDTVAAPAWALHWAVGQVAASKALLHDQALLGSPRDWRRGFA